MYVADPIERTHCLHITIGLHIAPPPLKYHPCRIFLGKIRFQDYTAEAVIFLKFLIYSWFFSLVYFLSGNHILFTFRLSWSQMSSLKFAFVFMYQNYTYTLTILKSTYTCISNKLQAKILHQYVVVGCISTFYTCIFPEPRRHFF